MLPSDPKNPLAVSSAHAPEHVYDIVDQDRPYDAHELLACVVDENSMIEYKAGYGKTLLTVFAKLDGMPVGIVATQRVPTTTGKGEIEIGGVLYAESADKAARFVMECNQTALPIIFFQDVMGFMVGTAAEQSGIIRSGAKLVNAVSNSIVPKITVIVGNSFGAGNYALCGKAYDPHFILAWPGAKYAVMGADQAAGTLFTVQKRKAEREGIPFDQEEKLYKEMHRQYEEHMDIRYGAARGWVDAIIPPHETGRILRRLLRFVVRAPLKAKQFHTGVIQV